MTRVWLILAVSVLWLVSCSKHPEVDDFKQIQLHWNAVDEAAESSESKDKCVIEITSKVMSDPMVLKSKLVEISYEVIYLLGKRLWYLSNFGNCIIVNSHFLLLSPTLNLRTIVPPCPSILASSPNTRC
jgi:hypothetical protein